LSETCHAGTKHAGHTVKAGVGVMAVLMLDVTVAEVELAVFGE
jgi:hypothetical protein